MTWALWQLQQWWLTASRNDFEMLPSYLPGLIIYAEVVWHSECVSSSKHQQQSITKTYSWVYMFLCLCIHVCMMNKGFSVYIGTQYTSYDDTFFLDVTKSNTHTLTHHTNTYREMYTNDTIQDQYDSSGKKLNKYTTQHTHIQYPTFPWRRSMNDVVFVSVGVANENVMKKK